MKIDIHWQLVGDHHDAWNRTRVVYAYLHPDAGEVLYVGKADGASSTVRTRWSAPDKRNFWGDLEQQRGIKAHRVLVGDLQLREGSRLSRQLLADVESLLIFGIEPWGNIASSRSRIDRPGLVVRNRGPAWPGPRELYDLRDSVETRS